MSLNGDFTDFSLQEILRLLARSGKTGTLRVESPEVEGEIQVVDGAISFAGGDDGSALWRRLLAAGLVTESQIDSSQRGDADLKSLARAGDVEEYLRDEIVECLYRFTRSRDGGFAFTSGAGIRPATGYRFDPEALFGEVDRRAAEWAEVEEVVSDLKADLRTVVQIDGERTVTPRMWTVIGGLVKKASVAHLSESLGWPLFETARECAHLIREGLIEFAETPKRAAAPTERGDTGAGWWSAPESEPTDESDRFLESVFAQLEATEPAPGQSEAGFVRRRLGVARDLLNPET